MRSKIIYISLIACVICLISFCGLGNYFSNYSKQVGDPVDSLNGVKVYYNGSVSNTGARNLTKDNYNLGLKYQCVEFVKRYYFEFLHHQMPNSYGNAKDFFDTQVSDGNKNAQRNLYQYTNPSHSKPQVNDIMVFSATSFNEYGHVAIVSAVNKEEIEIIQQNPGPMGKSRRLIPYQLEGEHWHTKDNHLLGWLRK